MDRYEFIGPFGMNLPHVHLEVVLRRQSEIADGTAKRTLFGVHELVSIGGLPIAESAPTLAALEPSLVRVRHCVPSTRRSTVVPLAAHAARKRF